MLLAAQVGPDYPTHLCTKHRTTMLPLPDPRWCNFSREPAAFGAIYDASLRAFLLCLYFDTHAKRIIPGNSQHCPSNPIPGQPYPHQPIPFHHLSLLILSSAVALPSPFLFRLPSPLDSFEKAKRKLLGKGDWQIPRNKLREVKKLESSIACLYTCCEYRVCELIICLQQQNAPAFLGFSQISANATRRDACVALPRHHI